MILRNRIISLLLALSIAMAACGVALGQHESVRDKASNICTECIGLG